MFSRMFNLFILKTQSLPHIRMVWSNLAHAAENMEGRAGKKKDTRPFKIKSQAEK